MKNIDQYLLEHIELNRRLIFGKRIINEKHGYNSEIIDYVYNSISPYIINSDQYKIFGNRIVQHVKWVINENNVGTCSWFPMMEIYIDWYRAEEDACMSHYSPNTQQLDDGITIRLNLSGRNRWELLDSTLASLSHELLHSYEDYKRRSNGKPSLSDTAGKTPYYAALKKIQSKNNSERTIANLLYNLASFERSARISEVYAELNNKTTVFTKEGILSALKETEAYEIYQDLYKDIIFIKKLAEDNSQEAEAIKASLVNAYNNIVDSGEHDNFWFPRINTCKRLSQIIIRKWHIFDKKWKQNVNKMVYDLLVNNFRIIR